MNIFLLVSLVIFAFSGLFFLVKQLQMLQQNSYFPSRYLKWLTGNAPLKQALLYLIASLLLFSDSKYWLMLFSVIVLVISVYEAVSTQKKSIKKLVFTARIKRMFVTSFAVFAILVLVYATNHDNLFGKISIILLLAFSIVTPILTLFVRFITAPVEKCVSKWYINDARKILKNHKSLKVIGITGSYGKTTTKFILSRILSEKYNVVCTPQSFNTPMGVVRTIRSDIKPSTEIFVCEMGAKNVGDIKEICDIVNPQFGIITSVGPQHLETFKSVDNVFKTKFELADAISKNGGKTYVNLDSFAIAERIPENSYLTYGTNNAVFMVSDITLDRFGSNFTVTLKDKKIELTTRLLGMHSIINIAGAVAIAYDLGVSENDIKFAVASLKPYEHRLELKTSVNSSLMIDDAYNSNPEGCLEAVRVLSSFKGMKKVIITPGLIELGDKEYEANFNLGLEAAKYCDIIILVGVNRSKPMADAVNTTDFNKDSLFVAKSFFEAMDIYSRFADNNTVLLIENDLPDNYLN